MLLAVILTALALYALWKYKKFRAPYDKLPGDTKCPWYAWLQGDLANHPGLNEAGLAYDEALMAKHPYLHRKWFGPALPIVYFYHPDAMRVILKSSDPKPRGSIITTGYDMGIPWLGEGILLTNGKRWGRSRRLLTPAFHFDILRPYMKIYNQCTSTMLDKIQKCSDSGESFDANAFVNLEALEVILRCAFSYESNCQTEGQDSEYVQAIQEIQQLWSDRSINPVHFVDFIYSLTAKGKRFYHLCKVAHAMTEKLIEKRKQEIASNPDLLSQKKCLDFIDTLIAARDPDGNGLSLLDIRNEADTFLFEGHDTTSSGMTWCLHALAQHPEYQDRICEELDSVLGDREEVEWDDLAQLEFTTMVIKEALRLNAAVPAIARESTEDMTIGGHFIPKGTTIMIHIWLLHNNPHIWEDPHTFRPERFHPDNKMDPFQFTPFSAGPRNCIGQHFAMNEMKVTIGRVVRKFRLSLDTERPAERSPTVTLNAPHGAYLYAKPR